MSNTPWVEARKVLSNMSDFERGLYYGMVEAWFIAQAKAGGPLTVQYSLTDPLVNYSPSGSVMDAENFYAPRPDLPPDTVEVMFDLKKVFATWMEIDREAALFFPEVSTHRSPFITRDRWVTIVIHCSEDATSDPYLYGEEGEDPPLFNGLHWVDEMIGRTDQLLEEEANASRS